MYGFAVYNLRSEHAVQLSFCEVDKDLSQQAVKSPQVLWLCSQQVVKSSQVLWLCSLLFWDLPF